MSDIKTLMPIDADTLDGNALSVYGTKTGSEVWTNKTLNDPTLTSPTISNPTIDEATYTNAYNVSDIGVDITNSHIDGAGELTFPDGGNIYHATATTTLQGISSSPPRASLGTSITIHIDSSWTWEHSSGLVLPDALDIDFIAGDVVTVSYVAASIWKVTAIRYAYGKRNIAPKAATVWLDNTANASNLEYKIKNITVKHQSWGRTTNIDLLSGTLAALTTNHMDTGETPVLSATWYYLWVGLNSDGTPRIKLSSSSSNPHSDFEYYTMVGALYHISGGAFRTFIQFDNNISYKSLDEIASGPLTTTGWTAFNTTAYIPPRASYAKFIVGAYSGTNLNWFAISKSSTGYGGVYHNCYSVDSTAVYSNHDILPTTYNWLRMFNVPVWPSGDNNFYYAAEISGCDIVIMGFELEVI